MEAMAGDLSCSVKDLLTHATLRDQIDLSRYVTDSVGMPTLTDIMGELAKPGRDPRKEFEIFAFAEGIEKIGDLQPGMRLPGIITNVAAFGAFVDIGVHQDGLVHVSQLADRFVKDPHQVVKVHERVMVRVLDVDLERNRISLSMKAGSDHSQGHSEENSKQRNKGQSPPRRKEKRSAAFNNPFAEALKKR